MPFPNQRGAPFPRATVDALLAGFEAAGLPAASIAVRAGHRAPADGGVHGARVPARTWAGLWAVARDADDDPALPSRVGGAVPFGMFGLLDYLAGSAETVDAALRSLESHMRAAASTVALRYAPPSVWLLASDDEATGSGIERTTIEFTLGLVVARLRMLTEDDPVAVVHLPGSRADGDPHGAYFGVPVIHDAPLAGLDVRASALGASLTTTDPALHRSLRAAARRLGLVDGEAPAPPARSADGDTIDLEARIRARLPGVLARGAADASSIAALIGVSGGALVRSLARGGRDLEAIVDRHRSIEALRQLRSGRTIEEAARAVGCGQNELVADFERWYGRHPSAWRKASGDEEE